MRYVVFRSIVFGGALALCFALQAGCAGSEQEGGTEDNETSALRGEQQRRWANKMKQHRSYLMEYQVLCKCAAEPLRQVMVDQRGQIQGAWAQDSAGQLTPLPATDRDLLTVERLFAKIGGLQNKAEAIVVVEYFDEIGAPHRVDANPSPVMDDDEWSVVVNRIEFD